MGTPPIYDITEARRLFPATTKSASFNTAVVGLASDMLATVYRAYLDEWVESDLDDARGEIAGEHARTAVAALIGADRSDISEGGSLPPRLAVRQVDQLACRDRQRGGALGVRQVRGRRDLPLQPRARGTAARFALRVASALS